MTDAENADLGTEMQQTAAASDLTSLMQESEKTLAVMSGGMGSPYHLVDTTTFDNHWKAPQDYEGHAASIGMADALCGHEVFSRMLPEDVTSRERVCGNCLSSLLAEVDDV